MNIEAPNYTLIPNSVLDNLDKFSGTELRVLTCIYRHNELALDRLVALVCRPSAEVKQAVANMEKAGLVRLDQRMVQAAGLIWFIGATV